MRACEKCIAKYSPRYKLVRRCSIAMQERGADTNGYQSLLIIVENLQEAWKVSRTKVELVQRCKCKQADARMIFLRPMLRGTHCFCFQRYRYTYTASIWNGNAHT